MDVDAATMRVTPPGVTVIAGASAVDVAAETVAVWGPAAPAGLIAIVNAVHGFIEPVYE